MDVARPYTAITSSLDADVLSLLAGRTSGVTGRETANQIGRSHRGVQLVLNRLVDQGLVHRQQAGRAALYTLNREHLAFPAVEIMAGMRTELLGRIRRSIAAWEVVPVHASLFGSAARRDGDTESDIDLLVIRPSKVDAEDPTWRSQLEQLSEDVLAWTGNHSGIAEVPANELDRLSKQQPPVVEDLLDHGVTLFGDEPASVLAGAT